MARTYTYADNLREELRALEPSDPECMRKLLNLLENALGVLAEHEHRINQAVSNAHAAANAASCLANGIQPD